MKKVSIIIPVYNGEKHIEKCINNVLKQTYKNLEIIIINDGSKDKTENILDEIQKLDNRIKIINKENTGVSDTRNFGINIATGEYIMFLDSDDYLQKNCIKELVKLINKNNNDLILFGFKVLGDNKRKNDTENLKEIKNKEEALKAIIATKKNIYGYIWRAIYSKKMLIENNILFPVGIKIYEDYLFLTKCIFYSNGLGITTKEYYNYVLGETSMSTKYIPTLSYDTNFVNEEIYKDIIIKKPELIKGYECVVCNRYLRIVQNIMKNSNQKFYTNVKKIRDIKKKYKYDIYICKALKRREEFSTKDYIAFYLFSLNLECIYMLLFKIKQKIR